MATPTRPDPALPSRFTTRAQATFRQGGRRRLLWAAAVTVALLIAVILLGPDQEAVKRRFEYYGAPGELQIMPQISIEEGTDAAHRLPRSLREPPPPARLEVEKEEPSPRGTVEVPPESFDSTTDVDRSADRFDPDAQDLVEDPVEMHLPAQTNPDWYLLVQVRPEYPVTAEESERRTAVIFVKAAFFVGPDGNVMDSLIQATNGSPVFTDEVIAKVMRWRFGWRVDPGAGRWIEMTFNFKSPYFSRRAR